MRYNLKNEIERDNQRGKSSSDAVTLPYAYVYLFEVTLAFRKHNRFSFKSIIDVLLTLDFIRIDRTCYFVWSFMAKITHFWVWFDDKNV